MCTAICSITHGSARTVYPGHRHEAVASMVHGMLCMRVAQLPRHAQSELFHCCIAKQGSCSTVSGSCLSAKPLVPYSVGCSVVQHRSRFAAEAASPAAPQLVNVQVTHLSSAPQLVSYHSIPGKCLTTDVLQAPNYDVSAHVICMLYGMKIKKVSMRVGVGDE